MASLNLLETDLAMTRPPTGVHNAVHTLKLSGIFCLFCALIIVELSATEFFVATVGDDPLASSTQYPEPYLVP